MYAPGVLADAESTGLENVTSISPRTELAAAHTTLGAIVSYATTKRRVTGRLRAFPSRENAHAVMVRDVSPRTRIGPLYATEVRVGADVSNVQRTTVVESNDSIPIAEKSISNGAD